MDLENISNESLIRLLKKRGVTFEELKTHFPPETSMQDIGKLQINHTIGTIYVHNDKDRTILRLAGLSTPIPHLNDLSSRMLDIKFESGQVNWSSSE